MRKHIRKTVLCLSLLVPAYVLAEEPGRDAAKPAANRSADEAAIRANVAAFVKAYTAGDAKGVAKLFLSEAQMIDQEGNTTQGREAIEKVFAGIFTARPGAAIDVEIDSLRFIGTALAHETGTTKVKAKSGELVESNHYSVMHVKTRTGQWLMAFAHDVEGGEQMPAERLKPLEWMVGDWIDESHESVVLTSCHWSENKNFLLQEIKVRIRGINAMDVSQRIGWDPLTKQIRSWSFDSEGGFGEGLWSRDGDRWIVKATGVRRDGVTATATNTFTPTGKSSYTWRSTDRTIGGESAPPLEVKVVRKPPEPVTQGQ